MKYTILVNFIIRKKKRSSLKTKQFVVKVEVLLASSYLTLCDPMDCSPPGSWDFPSKNTGVGCDFLLKGIFSTQGLNLLLLNWQLGSLLLSHQGSPRDVRQRSNFVFSYLYDYLKKKKLKFLFFLLTSHMFFFHSNI